MEDLLDILLCSRHKVDAKQVSAFKAKWTRAIGELVRKGEDVVMQGADDGTGALNAGIAEMFDSMLRFVELKRARIYG